MHVHGCQEREGETRFVFVMSLHSQSLFSEFCHSDGPGDSSIVIAEVVRR
jgi:hypothetical protein